MKTKQNQWGWEGWGGEGADFSEINQMQNISTGSLMLAQPACGKVDSERWGIWGPGRALELLMCQRLSAQSSIWEVLLFSIPL